MSKSKKEIPPPNYTLTECVDVKRVRDLLLSDLEINHETRNTLLKFLLQNGKLNCDYRPTEDFSLGRLYTSYGFLFLWNPLRAYLAQDYVDLDIQNCHPTILNFLAQKHGLDHTLLQSYIDNRDGWGEAFPKMKKIDALVAINNQDFVTDNPLFIEIKTIVKTLYGLSEYSNFKIEANKNPIGKFISRLLQYSERRMIEKVISGLPKKCKLISIIFDGIITDSVPDNLDELNKLIAPSKLVVKPWKIPKFKPKVDLQYFGKTCFTDIIKTAGRQYKSFSELLDDQFWGFLDCVRFVGGNFYIKVSPTCIQIIKDFGRYKHVTWDVDDTPVSISINAVVRKLSALITYHDATYFKPDSDDEFSMYMNMIAESGVVGDHSLVKPILDHIHDVWADSDKAVYEYIINWLSFIAQNPGDKTEVAIVLLGEEGTGKSTICDFIRKRVFGKHLCFKIPGLDKAVRSFNSHLSGKMLIVLEELKSEKHSMKVDIDRFKDLITSDEVDIERKGIDVQTERNTMNFLAFSNHENVLPMIEGMKRRVMVQRVSDSKKIDFAYFKKLQAHLCKPETAPTFLHYLKNRDLSKINLRHPPITTKKDESIWDYSDTKLKILYVLMARAIKGGNTSYAITASDFIDMGNKYNLIPDTFKLSTCLVGRFLKKYSNHFIHIKGIRQYHIEFDPDPKLLEEAIEVRENLQECLL